MLPPGVAASRKVGVVERGWIPRWNTHPPPKKIFSWSVPLPLF